MTKRRRAGWQDELKQSRKLSEIVVELFFAVVENIAMDPQKATIITLTTVVEL